MWPIVSELGSVPLAMLAALLQVMVLGRNVCFFVATFLGRGFF